MADQPEEERSTFSLEVTLERRGSFSAAGQGDLVLRAFQQFREEVKTLGTVTPPAETSSPEGESSAKHTPKPEAAAARVEVQAGLPPLPVFLKAKNPKNNAEAVAVMAIWAKKHDGTDEFTTKSVSDLWRGSSRKAAGNLARDIDLAAKNGWLFRLERGKWTTTEYGEQHVAALPATKKE